MIITSTANQKPDDFEKSRSKDSLDRAEMYDIWQRFTKVMLQEKKSKNEKAKTESDGKLP